MKVKEMKPSLVLLDLMMPGVDGYQVLIELKGDPVTVNIPVIVLTNLEGENIAEKTKELGATEHLIKSDSEPSKVVLHVRTAWVLIPPAALLKV